MSLGVTMSNGEKEDVQLRVTALQLSTEVAKTTANDLSEVGLTNLANRIYDWISGQTDNL